MTRAAILDTAQMLAANGRLVSTPTAELCRLAGVSNGTLFHHYPSRAALVGAVLEAGMAHHQELLRPHLDAPDAESGIRALVATHIRWITEEPQFALLFLTTPPAQLRRAANDRTIEDSQEFFKRLEGALARWGWPAADPLLARALLVGAIHELARFVLPDPEPLAARSVALVDGAWLAIRPLLGTVSTC